MGRYNLNLKMVGASHDIIRHGGVSYTQPFYNGYITR
eukprot:COSAG06_NODE_610_length_13844_cov_14.456359_16_plen_36_part_01